jgi:hypothetical protein
MTGVGSQSRVMSASSKLSIEVVRLALFDARVLQAGSPDD